VISFGPVSFVNHIRPYKSTSVSPNSGIIIIIITYLLFGRSRDRFPVVSLGIFSVVPSDKTMCTEVDSASENEYQGFLLG